MTDDRRPEMTDERLEAQLQDIYADDGARDPAHDRVTSSVLRVTKDTHQQPRRRWWQLGTPSGRGGAGLPLLAPVAIAAIAVVFVGLLAFGLIGPQDETAPAASPTAMATTVPSPSPSPLDIETSLAQLEPGFTVEAVAPGIERVVADGADFDLSALPPGEHIVFEDIDVSIDGAIWVVARLFDSDSGTADGPFAFELGSAGRFGPDVGFPRAPVKLIAEADGNPVVASRTAVQGFDGFRWLDDPRSISVSDFDGTTRFVQPQDVEALGEPSVLDPGTEVVLVLHSDGLGYTLGEDVGLHLWRDWPSWFEVCGPEPRLEHRGGTGCGDREVLDERGIGVGHDDGSKALLLADVVTHRIARGPDQAVWVIAGPTIDDLRARRAEESGAIYRIDPDAPGFRCENC